MSELLASLVAYLPKRAQRVAKALVAAVIPIVVAFVQALETGVGWKTAAWLALAGALGLSVHQVPNRAA